MLVPDVAEGKALPRTQRIHLQGGHQSLPMPEAPDRSASRVGDQEIGRGSPAHEVEGDRDLVGIGDRKKKRHRLADPDASRCLEGETESQAPLSES